MNESSWMLTLLATETCKFHAAADGDRLVVMEKTSAARYRECLARIHGFEQPIESAFAQVDRALLRTHLKTERLAADLEALGVRPERSAEPALAFDGICQALGWLYVVQRNTLFHGLITRHLATRIPDDVRIGGTYLAAFDGIAGQRMGELGVMLDRVAARSPSAASSIVQSAKAAFRSQRQWYGCERAVPVARAAEPATAAA